MKFMKLLIAVTCLLGLIAGAFAQEAETRTSKGTFGYIDRKTGMFHPLERTPLSAEAAAAITPTTGTFVFNVTITVSSVLPTTALINCAVSGGVSDLKTGFFSNYVNVPAKRTGNTATCTLSVPYEWSLATPTTDTVSMDISVSTATSSTAGSYEEYFTAPALTLKVPANGATTTTAISTTI